MYKKYINHHLGIKNTSGFTLVEILLVVALIGVMAAFLTSSYPAIQRRSRDSIRRNDIKEYQTAIENWANRNGGNFPVFSGNANTVAFCQTTLGLAACPNDPRGTPIYQVRSAATQYVLWAQLEQPVAPVTFFIACSNGRTGEHTATGGPACPLP